MNHGVQSRESLFHRRLGDLGVERRVLLLQLLQTSVHDVSLL